MNQGKVFFVLVHMSQEGIWGWPLLMCLGAVKPHGYSLGFGFHVDSKIYRVLKQKILYVQKLWKSLLTHGINRKHFCPKLSWTELFFLTGFAEILLGSAGSKALATFFRNTLKQECSIIFLAFHLGFLLYQVRPLYSLHGAYTKCSERWSIEFAISWASLIFLGRAESCSLSETFPFAQCSDGLWMPCACFGSGELWRSFSGEVLCQTSSSSLNRAESGLAVLQDWSHLSWWLLCAPGGSLWWPN